MDRKIIKKKPKYSNTLIYSLKGLLLLLLGWNLQLHAPNSFFALIAKPKPSHKLSSTTPYIEEISYNQVLGITSPLVNHYMKWEMFEIPYLDPEVEGFEYVNYQSFTRQQFANIWIYPFSIHYKGQQLHPNKVNAILIGQDGSSAICEDEGDFKNCFYSNLRHFRNDFALWLSIETEEQKTFFSRILVTENPDLQINLPEKEYKFWAKLINRDKHKSIDNLSVVKPVFQTYDYLFKWGNWERFAHGPKGGRRVKLGIQDFKDWVGKQPYLYKDGEYVPFSMSINYWNRKKWGNNCRLYRKEEKASILASNECFKEMTQQIKVGDVLSIFIWIEGDFIKQLEKNSLQRLPGFMINDQYIQFSIPIEIVENSFNPFHAPLKLTTSTFGFQLNSSLNEQSIVKMDTHNPKNSALFDHYSNNQSADIIHISDFKTIRRVITHDDIYIPVEKIAHKKILPNKLFKVETFPEFYDFNIQPPLIKLRGLSTVLDKTTYPFSLFKNSKEGFEMYIGDEQVKLLQCTFTIIPKNGEALQYVTENFTRSDIRRRLRKLKPTTSLYFDKILFERKNGEKMVFPLATAMHLR